MWLCPNFGIFNLRSKKLSTGAAPTTSMGRKMDIQVLNRAINHLVRTNTGIKTEITRAVLQSMAPVAVAGRVKRFNSSVDRHNSN